MDGGVCGIVLEGKNGCDAAFGATGAEGLILSLLGLDVLMLLLDAGGADLLCAGAVAVVVEVVEGEASLVESVPGVWVELEDGDCVVAAVGASEVTEGSGAADGMADGVMGVVTGAG